MDNAPKSASKSRGRPFPPGNRANPNGRPQGSRNSATLILERIMIDDAKDVARAVVDAAKSGDMAAAKMILDRACPIPKGRRVALELPEIKTAVDVLAAHAKTIAAMAGGEISPDEAAVIASVLEAKRRAIETVDLTDRIARLEAAAEAKR
jgi:hypothetical protein